MRRRPSAALLVAALIIVLPQTAGATSAPRVRVRADLSCLIGGGVRLDLMLENT